MKHRAMFLALSVVLLPGGLSVFAQVVQTLPRIAVTRTSPTMVNSKPADLEIKLMDSTGAPFIADKDLQWRVSAYGGRPDRDLVVIQRGQSQAHLTITRDVPGVSYVSVQPVGASSALGATGVQIAFSAKRDYRPLLPLSLFLNVIRGAKLRASVDKVHVTGLIEDRARVPVPAPRDYEVTFPGLSDLIKPYPMHFKAGSPEGEEVVLAAQTPGVLPFTPVVNPPLSIVSNASSLEFDSPILGLRIICDPCYVKAVSRQNIKVKIGLMDVHANWIASDGDRTVILRVDPPDAGRLGTSEFTILRGTSTYETTFTPYKECIAKITALAEQGFIIQTAQIEFHYAFSLFLIVAAIGGMAGGSVRELIQTGKLRFKSFIRGVLAGALFGMLAYILAPALVSVSFKPEILQNASKLFEAFLWGFVGGGGGTELFARLLPGGGQQPTNPVPPPNPANAAASASKTGP